ncbi:MAG TPA: hypothetical protein VNV41_00830 [Candidatus Acidoferrales bacterium]|nr:hypothetical protein [Candidatus Acidoferrales bacterium]
MLFRYINPQFTAALIEERKTKIEAYKGRLVAMANGLQLAADHYRDLDPAKAALFQAEAGKFAAQVPGANELLDTRRHGCFRDHGVLDVAKQEIEKGFGGPITYETLATLVTVAQIAAGHDEEPVGSETIRKDLSNFLTRNSNWNPAGNSNP